MNANIVQAGLAVCGIASLFMAMGHNQVRRKWAPVVGLVGQPFWLVFALSTNAWGLLVTIAAFTSVYLFGAYEHWKKPELLVVTPHAMASTSDTQQHMVYLAAEIADHAAVSAIFDNCPFITMGNLTWYDTLRAGESAVDAPNYDRAYHLEVVAAVQRAVRYLDMRRVIAYHPTQKALVRLKP